MYVHGTVLSIPHGMDRTGRIAKCSGTCVYVHKTVLSLHHGKDRQGKSDSQVVQMVHVCPQECPVLTDMGRIGL